MESERFHIGHWLVKSLHILPIIVKGANVSHLGKARASRGQNPSKFLLSFKLVYACMRNERVIAMWGFCHLVVGLLTFRHEQ